MAEGGIHVDVRTRPSAVTFCCATIPWKRNDCLAYTFSSVGAVFGSGIGTSKMI